VNNPEQPRAGVLTAGSKPRQREASPGSGKQDQVVGLGSELLSFQQVVEMAASCLQFDDWLGEMFNYSLWKERIMLVLMENDV